MRKLLHASNTFGRRPGLPLIPFEMVFLYLAWVFLSVPSEMVEEKNPAWSLLTSTNENILTSETGLDGRSLLFTTGDVESGQCSLPSHYQPVPSRKFSAHNAQRKCRKPNLPITAEAKTARWLGAKRMATFPRFFPRILSGRILVSGDFTSKAPNGSAVCELYANKMLMLLVLVDQHD